MGAACSSPVASDALLHGPLAELGRVVLHPDECDHEADADSADHGRAGRISWSSQSYTTSIKVRDKKVRLRLPSNVHIAAIKNPMPLCFSQTQAANTGGKTSSVTGDGQHLSVHLVAEYQVARVNLAPGHLTQVMLSIVSEIFVGIRMEAEVVVQMEKDDKQHQRPTLLGKRRRCLSHLKGPNSVVLAARVATVTLGGEVEWQDLEDLEGLRLQQVIEYLETESAKLAHLSEYWTALEHWVSLRHSGRALGWQKWRNSEPQSPRTPLSPWKTDKLETIWESDAGAKESRNRL